MRARMGGIGRGSLVRGAVLAAILVLGVLAPAGATSTSGAAATEASGPVPGTGAARPRILYDPGTEADLAARLDREPYRSVFLTSNARANAYDDRPLGDLTIPVQRDLTRAAKQRAFEYALDRTVVGGAIVPFATPADRQAAGDFARDVLLQMLDRSRLAVDPPIGGWDRDITTSEEIILTATTYDTLLGAGYDLGADRAEIVRRISSVTDELYENFVDPSTVGGVSDLHQNNHRTKSGAAMAAAAIALADDVDPATARAWFDQGVDYVDDLQRHTLITGDGAYAEGPFYYRFTLQNLLPFANAWERLLGDSSWTTASGLTVPALAHTPLFARTQQWMMDLTLPDGSLAPIDDGNPGRSSYFGVLPTWLPDTESPAGYWRWANAPTPYETDGNIDLGPEAIVAYDDGIAAAPPSWEPTQFYEEGGNAVFRSDWSSDATMALVLGEHDTASEFGKDRTGTGRYPQSHEHAEPGAFLLYAHGEHLALDPGYLSFSEHADVNKPEHHNVVLVDGAGPSDYLQASFAWADDPTGRPPAEGQSTIARTLDGAAADVATVATAYRGASIQRRFLFGQDEYLIVADRVQAEPGVDLAWMLHGNGGGTSGGTYADAAAGGTWTRGGARLSSGIATSGGDAALSTESAVHEAPGGVRSTHTALRATTTADDELTEAVQVLYPSAAGAAAPSVSRTTTDTAATVAVDDGAADRALSVVQPIDGALAADDRTSGGTGLMVVDRRTDGTLRSAWADEATSLVSDGTALVSTDEPGSLGFAPADGSAEIVATGQSAQVTVGDLGYVPTVVDGACASSTADGQTTITLNRERRVTVRSDGGNARPAADPGPNQRVDPGSAVRLDGTASCDSDGDALRYEWELVSAPAGSAWRLDGAETPQPTLAADRVGPYRVRLVVTDADGAISQSNEVVIIAGPQCGDGVDDDLDGLIDTDDPDCDGANTPPGPTTTVAPTDPGTDPAPQPTAPPGSGSGTAAPAVPVSGNPRYTG